MKLLPLSSKTLGSQVVIPVRQLVGHLHHQEPGGTHTGLLGVLSTAVVLMASHPVMNFIMAGVHSLRWSRYQGIFMSNY